MNSPNNAEKLFLSVRIIFVALLAAQFAYFLAGLFLMRNGNLSGGNDLNRIFMFITPVIILSCILASKFIYSKIVSGHDKNLSIENKIIDYRKGNIIKSALIEGANIFNISIMIITCNYLYAAFFAVLIAFYIFERPSRDKFILEYEISADEAIKIIS